MDGKGGYELYDHQTDAVELHNLTSDPTQKNLISKLSARLHERISAAKKNPEGLVQIQGAQHKR